MFNNIARRGCGTLTLTCRNPMAGLVAPLAFAAAANPLAAGAAMNPLAFGAMANPIASNFMRSSLNCGYF